jgi:hypothetical protein
VKLLSVSADAKTVKGEKQGYLTGILYLAPANLSGHNVCVSASPGCTQACLNTAGRAGIFPSIMEARIRKTNYLFDNRAAFLDDLTHDIKSLVRRAKKQGLTPCVRLNGTSDLPWLALAMADKFPNVIHYDYSKIPKPWQRLRPNYHLTFSNSELNLAECFDALEHHINVAVVFPIKKGRPLPSEWHGYPIIDGDISDLRFLDTFGVVGLRAKGKAKKDSSGFVQIAESYEKENTVPK